MFNFFLQEASATLREGGSWCAFKLRKFFVYLIAKFNLQEVKFHD